MYSIYGLLGKEFLAGRGVKTFEAALGILKTGHRRDLYQPIKNPAHQMAISRLIVTHRACNLTRAYGNLIVVLLRRQKLWQLSDRHCQVSITQKSKLASGLQHPRLYSVPFTAMFSPDQPDTGMLSCQLFHNLNCAVNTPIVDDQDFGLICLSFHKLYHFG